MTKIAPIIAPSQSLEDVVRMTREDALAALTDFCTINGYPGAFRSDAFDLFRLAVQTPGIPVEVKTPDWSQVYYATAVHNCMQAITDDPVAASLAERAFDAVPGTHFEHDISENACTLTNTCTNART